MIVCCFSKVASLINTILRKSIQNAILSYYIRRHLSHYIFRVILQSTPARLKVHLFCSLFSLAPLCLIKFPKGQIQFLLFKPFCIPLTTPVAPHPPQLANFNLKNVELNFIKRPISIIIHGDYMYKKLS
jgi:hypothetical protein